MENSQQRVGFGSTGLSRRLLLGGVAGALGAGLVLSDAASASATDSVRADGIKISKIGDITDPDITGKFGLDYGDLGIPVRCPDGRTLYVFGDSFTSPWGSDWRSPTGLWSRTRGLSSGIRFDAAVGGTPAGQLIDYQHGDDISTIIPSDLITIGDTMYLQGVVNRGFGNVIWSGIWTSKDNGATWQDSGARFPADAYDNMWQLFTWAQGSDGWIYVYSAKFLRASPMILTRVRPDKITDPSAYEPWGKSADGTWQWGAGPDTVTDQIIGEMSLRQLGNRWIFTWFNAPDYRIDAMVLDHPTQDLRNTEHVTLLHGTSWDAQDVNHVAQLYGSYVIPGSSLNDLYLTVSQWNTGDNSVYHVMEYRFQGLADRL